MVERLSIQTTGPGLHDVTERLQELVRRSGLSTGLCTVMIQHTSASLTIQENADPAARADLQAWLSRLVAENDPLYTHQAEGPDDMPAHIKAALTDTSLSIPMLDGRLALGIWQGVCVWEHRRRGAIRWLVVHLGP